MTSEKNPISTSALAAAVELSRLRSIGLSILATHQKVLNQLHKLLKLEKSTDIKIIWDDPLVNMHALGKTKLVEIETIAAKLCLAIRPDKQFHVWEWLEYGDMVRYSPQHTDVNGLFDKLPE